MTKTTKKKTKKMCVDCGAPLNRYNKGVRCARCHAAKLKRDSNRYR